MSGLLSTRRQRPDKAPTPPVEAGQPSAPPPKRKPTPPRASPKRGRKSDGSVTHSDGATTFGERRQYEVADPDKVMDEIRRGIEGDARLRGRPALRGVIYLLSTSKLRNPDGSVAKLKNGEGNYVEMPMTMSELLVHTAVTKAVTPGPDQLKWWENVTTLLVGTALKKPEMMESGGPAPALVPGAPGAPEHDDDDDVTPEKMAQDFLHWHGLATQIMEQQSAQKQRELTAIDVKAELIAEADKGKAKRPDDAPEPEPAAPPAGGTEGKG